MNLLIIKYLVYLYGISHFRQKKFLEKLDKVPDEDKEKILVVLYKQFLKFKKQKKKLNFKLDLIFNQAEEQLEKTNNTLIV